MTILTLPTAFQASQAGFGIAYGGTTIARRSGVEDVFQNAPDRWVASFQVNPMLSEGNEWRLFAQQLRGPAGLVYVHDLSYVRRQGLALTATRYASDPPGPLIWANDAAVFIWEEVPGEPFTWDIWPDVPADQTLELRAAASAGATTVVVGGLWPRHPSVISAGDYIQIEHWLYLVAADAESDADGVATVPIVTPLWRAAAIGTKVVLDCPATLMRLDQRDVRWNRAARDRRMPISFTFREVLPTEGVPD